MSKSQRLMYRLLVSVGVLMTVLFGLWWFIPSNVPNNFSGFNHIFDVGLFLLVTFVIWHQILGELFTWNVARSMKHPYYMKPRPGQRVAFVTAFVPGKEPYDVLEQALKSMVSVDYPHDTWLLDEGNDSEAKLLCEKYGIKHHTRKDIERYNRASGRYKAKTKGGNLNSWFNEYGINYDFVAQMDNDFVLRKDFLTMKLGYFNDPDVAFVSSPQIYGNTKDSWIAAGSAEQQYRFYGSTQKGLFGKGMVLPIGSHHIVRVAAIAKIGGYACHLAEDHLTGMAIYSARAWKSVYVPETLAVGEGPSNWEAYFGQQKRWAYSLMDILFKHSPKVLPKMKREHAVNYFLLQLHYFYGLSQVIGVFLITLFFVFNVQSTDFGSSYFLLLYVPLLVWQLVVSSWLQRFNINPEKESGLLIKGKIVSLAAWPVYFLAFYEFVRRKPVSYTITPKGKQKNDVPMKLFVPHFVLGTITAIDVVWSLWIGNYSGVLFFWALLNTFVMYSFVVYAIAHNVGSLFRRKDLGLEQAYGLQVQ